MYSGQLDIIVDALCTEQWINNMTWAGLPQWQQQPEQPIAIGGIPQGFVRSYKNFAFYRIFRAGHMVNACLYFLLFVFLKPKRFPLIIRQLLIGCLKISSMDKNKETRDETFSVNLFE